MKITEHKEMIKRNYSKLISMVEDGYNISDALNKLKMCRTTFYKCITKEQKAELKMIKTANSTFGVSYK